MSELIKVSNKSKAFKTVEKKPAFTREMVNKKTSETVHEVINDKTVQIRTAKDYAGDSFTVKKSNGKDYVPMAKHSTTSKGGEAGAATSKGGGAGAATSKGGGVGAATSKGGGAGAATSKGGGAGAAATSKGGGAGAATSKGGGAGAATSKSKGAGIGEKLVSKPVYIRSAFRGGAAKAGQAAYKAGSATVKTAAREVPYKMISVSSGVDIRREMDSNLGTKAIKDSRQVYITTKNTAKGIVRTGKGTVKTVKTGARVAKQAVQVTKASVKATMKAVKAATKAAVTVVKTAAKAVAAMLSNPIGQMALIAVLVILLVVVVINVLSSIIPSTSATTKYLMGEELYKEIAVYLMEKDRAVIREFTDFEKQPEYSDIEEGDIEKVKSVTPTSSMRLMGAYLYAKYENDLTFAIAKSEIDSLHAGLYTVRGEVGERSEEHEEEYEVPVLDDKGKPMKDKDGKVITETKTRTVVETFRTLTVYLEGKTLTEYLNVNIQTMLTPQQYEFYEYLKYTAGLIVGDIGPPFEDEDWRSHITQHVGEIGPIDGLPHRGMDISYPEGTPILNVINGTVIDISNHESWGLNVVVESDDGVFRVRYAHMSAISVSLGEKVAAGDYVGAVGNTGASTGAHLHIEIEENGVLVNPDEYLPD